MRILSKSFLLGSASIARCYDGNLARLAWFPMQPPRKMARLSSSIQKWNYDEINECAGKGARQTKPVSKVTRMQSAQVESSLNSTARSATE